VTGDKKQKIGVSRPGKNAHTDFTVSLLFEMHPSEIPQSPPKKMTLD
jgi:hypothetical protein